MVSRCITAKLEDVGQLSRSTIHGSYEQYTVAVRIADDISYGLVSLILHKGVRDQSQAVTIMQPFNCIRVDVHLMCIHRVKALTTAKHRVIKTIEGSSPHMQIRTHFLL